MITMRSQNLWHRSSEGCFMHDLMEVVLQTDFHDSCKKFLFPSTNACLWCEFMQFND
eukprot:UN16381